MMVTTADHDDRVVPLHTFKYIAELQHIAGQGDI
jgi:prolyl oligopeptidase